MRKFTFKVEIECGSDGQVATNWNEVIQALVMTAANVDTGVSFEAGNCSNVRIQNGRIVGYQVSTL